MERPAERRAENEATFRAANETLDQKATELGLGEEATPYICECESETCSQIVQLTGAEYEQVRGSPRTFVVAPGHQSSHDEVVYETPRFTVVEKTGREGELVAERDPRAAR